MALICSHRLVYTVLHTSIRSRSAVQRPLPFHFVFFFFLLSLSLREDECQARNAYRLDEDLYTHPLPLNQGGSSGFATASQSYVCK